MDRTGVLKLKNGILAGSLALMMFCAQAGQEVAAQQAIPDAPRPQTRLPDAGSVAPGIGTGSSSSGGDTSPAGSTPSAPAAANPASANAAPPSPAGAAQADSATLPGPNDQSIYVAPSGQGVQAATTFIANVNFVIIPFTVETSKGVEVAGLRPEEVQVYENGVRQHLSFWTSDMFPLSVALVVDQSMTQDEMTRLNNALGALPNAFTQYDEIAVYTYNKSTKEVTAFTSAQSARLTQAIERSKGSGRDALLAGSLEGPMANTTVINNQQFDPNTQAVRGPGGITINAPREYHPLNDAILRAATALSTRPIQFRRVVYVISDGKEYGSEASLKQVTEYLQHNRIEVDATIVGDSAVKGLGWVDTLHLPLMMRDDVLPAYVKATGGNLDAEFRTGEIEKSFSRIAGEVRDRYTLGYYSHEPFIDGKPRSVEVRVLRPNLNVIAEKRYFPSAMEVKPHVAPTTP
jgi:VWFA-related protein